MSILSSHQTKDLIGLLVCCCIKWDDAVANRIIPTWDDKKLYRLQTLLHLNSDSLSLLDQAKHDIEFTNHWRVNELSRYYCSGILNEYKDQAFFAVLVILSSQSYTTNIQLKCDAELVKSISDEFLFTGIQDKAIFKAAKSFSEFTQSIEALFQYHNV